MEPKRVLLKKFLPKPTEKGTTKFTEKRTSIPKDFRITKGKFRSFSANKRSEKLPSPLFNN